MSTGVKIVLGAIAVATGIGVVVYFAMRRNLNPYKPSTEYFVDPQYRLPAGAQQIDIATIPPGMVDAVRWVHRYFDLHEAYMDDMNRVYLVETHEGFDPLVFLVVPKEEVA